MVSVHVLASSCLFHRRRYTGDVSSTIFGGHERPGVRTAGDHSSWKPELPSGPGGFARSRTILVPSGPFPVTATRRVVDPRTGQQLPPSNVSSELILRSQMLCECLPGELSPGRHGYRQRLTRRVSALIATARR